MQIQSHCQCHLSPKVNMKATCFFARTDLYSSKLACCHLFWNVLEDCSVIVTRKMMNLSLMHHSLWLPASLDCCCVSRMVASLGNNTQTPDTCDQKPYGLRKLSGHHTVLMFTIVEHVLKLKWNADVWFSAYRQILNHQHIEVDGSTIKTTLTLMIKGEHVI